MQSNISLSINAAISALLVLWAAHWMYNVPSGFHADDYIFVERLAPVLQGLNRAWHAEVLGKDLDYFFRPVTFSVIAIAAQFDSPFVLHALSGVLHLIVSLLVFHVVSVLVCNKKAGLLAMCLAMFHQAVVMPVYWISSVGDLLYTTFGLLAYLQMVKGHRCLLLVFLTLALLSKETAVTLPAVFLVASMLRRETRSKSIMLVSTVVVSSLYLAYRYWAIGSFSAGGSNHIYFNLSAETVRGVTRYVLELASPVPLLMFPRNSIYMVTAALALCWIIALRSALRLKLTLRLTMCCVLILLPLIPVVAVYGKWYLYGPVIIVSIVLAHIPFTRTLTTWLMAFPIAGLIASQYYSQCFSASSRMQKQILAAGKQTRTPIVFTEWRTETCGDVPVFSWHRQVEAAFRREYGYHQQFRQ